MKKSVIITQTFTSGSAFVRAQPTTMPVKEVVEKAKEAGFTIKPNTVHSVRHSMKGKEKLSKQPVNKKLARRYGTKRGEKSTFVRSMKEAKQAVAELAEPSVSATASTEPTTITMADHAKRMFLAAATFLGFEEAARILQKERWRAVDAILAPHRDAAP